MRSAAFSPIIILGALVFPETWVGIIEASATLRPLIPWTRSLWSTTAILSFPILQVPTGWYVVSPTSFTHSNNSISLTLSGPGAASVILSSSIIGAVIMDLAMRIAFKVMSISISAERKLKFIIGGLTGDDDTIWIDPVLSGRIA